MQAIDKPWKQLERAESYIEKMASSKTLEEYEEHWKDFLHNLERAWNKLTHHLNRSPKYESWKERHRTVKLRKSDSLLSYLVNARGAEEHTVEDITRQQSGGVGINPAYGNTLHINYMTINNGQIFIDSKEPIKVDFMPNRLELIDVVNRGRTYYIPTSHLDTPFKPTTPLKLRSLALSFTETTLNSQKNNL